MVLGPSGDDMLEGRERRRLSSCRGNEGERRTRDQVINSVVCRIIGGGGSDPMELSQRLRSLLIYHLINYHLPYLGKDT